MDGQGDTNTHIKSVEDRHPAQPPLFRTEREHRHGHGEGDGGMRRRPAPEDPAAQKAEVEDMTYVRADAVRRMDATRNRLVGGGDKRAEEFSLTDSPASQNGPAIFGNDAERKKNQRQGDGQQSANPDGRPHPEPQFWVAGGEIILPVESGQDEDGGEHDGDEMPDKPPAFEAANEIARNRHQKLFHAEMIRQTRKKAIGFEAGEQVFSFQFQVFRKATSAPTEN